MKFSQSYNFGLWRFFVCSSRQAWHFATARRVPFACDGRSSTWLRPLCRGTTWWRCGMDFPEEPIEIHTSSSGQSGFQTSFGFHWFNCTHAFIFSIPGQVRCNIKASSLWLRFLILNIPNFKPLDTFTHMEISPFWSICFWIVCIQHTRPLTGWAESAVTHVGKKTDE